MQKREKGCCKKCGGSAGEENLSNKKLCYECAKASILENFNYMWSLKHQGAGG